MLRANADFHKMINVNILIISQEMHMIHNLYAVWLVKCVLLSVISVKKQYVPQENNTVIP